jgi:ribosome-associated protein
MVSAAPTAQHAEEDARAFAVDAARLCADSHCEDVLIFDVTGVSPVTSFIVIATGTSDRQIKSVADELAEFGAPHGFRRYGNERDEHTTWLVADFVDVVVHLFEPATRAHYDLEMMWGDAPQVSWRRG